MHIYICIYIHICTFMQKYEINVSIKVQILKKLLAISLCCSVFQCVAMCCSVLRCSVVLFLHQRNALQTHLVAFIFSSTLQHTATHRNAPQHTATHRNTPQHTAIHLQQRNKLQAHFVAFVFSRAIRLILSPPTEGGSSVMFKETRSMFKGIGVMFKEI